MFRYLLFSLLVCSYCSTAISQPFTLNGSYDANTSKVFLYWNMINGTSKSTYVLLRSNDQNKWREVVTDKVFQQYSIQDTFDYSDKVNSGEKCYYRLMIINEKKEAITFSNIISVNAEQEKNTWAIYPNPVNDILQIVCKGTSEIKGVINAIISDVTGQIVIRFRSGSVYRALNIPVSQLRNGMYIVQVSILNEVVMRQQFVKQ